PKDFINYMLTGNYATDNLSAAGLVNLMDNKYYQEYFDILGIPLRIMPDVHGISEPMGKVSGEVSKLTGLAEGTPVVTGWMDTLCCSLGCGLVEHGLAFNYSGSSETICLASRDFSHAEGLVVGPVFDLFFIGGGASTSGYSLKWFRDTFGQTEREIESHTPNLSAYQLFDRMAATVPPGSEGLIFLPYLSGERSPIWDPNARGVFIGITKMHTRSHFIRAIMEGVAYSNRHICEIAEKASGIKVEGIRAAGGGAKSNIWNQIKADVLGKKYLRLKELEVGAAGAAMLAGMGAGIFKDQREASKNFVHVDEVIEPVMQNHAAYDKYFTIYKELYPLLKDTFARL
ncbi:MAG: FGGY-family carbohydrate kinase, partial [Dehalococcoidia bacterium]|nr:FGGY-family carbohydrate kinase [Dehalococcoidia bacterium]